MGVAELLGVAASVSLPAGWRLYLCVFATGLAMRFGRLALPSHLHALDVLANPWVLGVAFIGLVAEFFADKVAWLDSAWDAIHSFVRPVGGALLALAIVDAQDLVGRPPPSFGGGAALLSHGGKASARAVVNASPEPVSNVVVSTGEDVATGGLLFLVLANPAVAAAVAVIVLIVSVLLLFVARRLLRQLRGLFTREEPPGPGAAR